MYRVSENCGDAVAVPQLLFSKLAAAGADDGRFRVALQLLHAGGGDAETLSAALRMPRTKVEAALHYWEGAGLIEREGAVAEPAAPARRPAMTTRQVVAAGAADPTLGWLLEELQRLFGAVLGQSDANLFVTLYKQDGFDADLVLLAATVAKREGAQRKAGYTQKVLFSWREAGITNSAMADRYLKLLDERQGREKQLALMMGLEWDPFTRADKKKIAVWFEEYGYGFDMVDAARLTAGDKRNSVAYLAGVLKKWYGKGYRTVREVQQGDENKNLRVFREDAGGEDLLQSAAHYVPMKKRNGR